jgi:hypothetical protein
LNKENRSNVSSRLRLGLEKKRVIDLKMAGMGGGGEWSVGGGRGDIDIDQIDEILQVEAGNKAVRLHSDLKDAHAVKGADGKFSKVDQKWQAEDAQSTLTQGTAGGEEVSSAEPVGGGGPSARKGEPPAPRDASKTVGNAIFYGNTRDREGAGRNAKAFLGAAQRVRKNVHATNQLKAAVAARTQLDTDWFTSHFDADELVPQPPPGIGPNPSGRAGFATSRGLADSIGGKGDALVHGSRSNAELLMLHAGRHVALDQHGEGQPAADIPGALPVDLAALEQGLGLPPGEIVPLSDEHIQGQIDEWKQVGTQPVASGM